MDWNTLLTTALIIIFIVLMMRGCGGMMAGGGCGMGARPQRRDGSHPDKRPDEVLTGAEGMKTLRPVWWRLLILLLVLLPFAMLFLSPGPRAMPTPFAAMVFWLALLFCFWVILFIIGMPEAQMDAARELGPRMLPDAEQPDAVKSVMQVSVATEGADGVRIFRGRLRESADAVYERLKGALGAQTVPMVQEDEQAGAAVVLMPRGIERQRLEHPTRPAVHWLLFGLTVVTTTWAG